ncbi:MAG: transporter substrate-binding domain-containing protein [Lachnospiraceae bacterium]|nr:transporter substrate-binding domain-containing protein [Lachnospiraceae bacterium]
MTELDDIKVTQPYLELNRVFVAPSELAFSADNNMRVAVDKTAISMEQTVNSAYPNFTIQEYDSMDDCFQAVNDKKADVILGKRYVVVPIYQNPQTVICAWYRFADLTTIVVSVL